MRTGRPARTARAQVLAASRICLVCGHDGSDSTDHIIPLDRGGDSSVNNQAPCHHLPCPTCAQRCNRAKGTKLLSEMKQSLRTSEHW